MTAGQQPFSGRDALRLLLLALCSLVIYIAIVQLSWRFQYGSPGPQRPILLVLGLLALNFVLYLLAYRVVSRTASNWLQFSLVLGSAVAFRAVMLPSAPIQEVDIYRYLWDGAVLVRGVSPFAFSPAQIRTAHQEAEPVSDPRLAKLLDGLNGEPPLATVLNRVHFGELPTVYPPMSQAVFALVAWGTPPTATVRERVLLMKAALVGFDLATLLVLAGILHQCRAAAGLSLLYGWCPLVVKEFSNSGHLDAIAVFWCTVSAYFVVVLISSGAGRTTLRSWGCAVAACLSLTCAIGAKLYPVVLVPLLVLMISRHLGWIRAGIMSGALLMGIVGSVWPMLPVNTTAGAEGAGPTTSSPSDPSRGLQAFFRRWEMNDFLFLVVVENLKPDSQTPVGQKAWFTVLPDQVRRSATEWLKVRGAPFLIARALTSGTFIVLAFLFAVRAVRAGNTKAFCEASFLTLAWFWLLCPTQNPWYWTWAMPFLPFAKGRPWLCVSGLVLLYYTRFWFGYHWPEDNILGTQYKGTAFFDFVVPWLEFGPWFIWLTLTGLLRSPRSEMPPPQS